MWAKVEFGEHFLGASRVWLELWGGLWCTVSLTTRLEVDVRGGTTSKWCLKSAIVKRSEEIQNHNYGWNIHSVGLHHWPQDEAFHLTNVF